MREITDSPKIIQLQQEEESGKRVCNNAQHDEALTNGQLV